MKAAIVRAPGVAPVYGDFAEPQPTDDLIRVTVVAAALSHVTRARATGRHYSSSGDFPFVPGIDGVGLADDGRQVYFAMPEAPHGALAEQTLVRADRCIDLPDGLDATMAAAIANPGMSSWAALTERAKLKPGETVLVNGATGASGRLAVKIARHLGAARVIATGRNAAVLAEVGADEAIVLEGEADALERRFMAVFAEGVDVVVDYLWGMSAERLLIAAAKAGRDAAPLRFVEVGSMSGETITLPSAVLRASAIELMGSGVGSVPLDRMMVAARDLLREAVPVGLTIPVRQVPLWVVEQAWAAPDDGRRVVFTP
ncbi:alcohol dehydrogenase [Pleomorphomonas diazotrophica]|uniref:Alcohol dehydrogenase n=1 Tax=Pleomorphomonas diazotrophica TaxID=1166257 RepID=A0A1I4S9T3_9HYPH|nr:zinc-binding alcohol dehydrogenase family protein [Pleomorphomonas diazotrophica]PKR88793.1 alcohol dehydrogenase [Pleomorphomonas diazotrophica]SFM61258.1 NADPH:quinone reductase [Pleomorphomonas diazotrophica]